MFRQGDIVAVPFPFTDLSQSKLRPALVLSTERLNRTGDLILVMITSRDKHDGLGLAIQQQDLTIPLPSQSFIRFNRVVTMDEMLVKKKISEASPALVTEVIAQLNTLF